MDEATDTPVPPVVTPPAFASPVQPSLYRQAFRIVRANRRTLLLPLLVTEAPVALLLAAATFVLYWGVYPDAKIDSFTALQDDPSGLILALAVMNAIYCFLSLVGLAATTVAARNVIAGKPIALTAALDPAFTRMGGLLGLGFVYYGLLFVVAIGILPAIFFLIRFGLALPSFILEGQTLGQSLKSSWGMLRGRMLRFTGLILVLAVVVTVALAVLALALSLVIVPFLSSELTRNDNVLITTAFFTGGGLMAVPIGAFVMTVLTLFYLREKGKSGA